MPREIVGAVLTLIRVIRLHIPLASRGGPLPLWPNRCAAGRECYSRLLADRDALDQDVQTRIGFDELTKAIRDAHDLITAHPAAEDSRLGCLFDDLLATPLYVWWIMVPPRGIPGLRGVISSGLSGGSARASVEPFPIDDELLNNLREAALAFAGESDDEGSAIPPEHRTRPLGIAEAARLMGHTGRGRKAGELLRRAMDGGAVKYVKFTRQSYIFDRRDFPAKAHPKLDPTGPN
jgi:hypothetical protein